MKIRHKMMLLALLGLLAAPTFIVGPSGKPLMSLNDWMPDNVSLNGVRNKLSNMWNKSGAKLQGGTSTGFGMKTPRLYKWQDAQGRWQFSNEPPPAAAGDVLVQDMPQMANIMQPVEVRERGQADSGNGGSGFKLAFPTSVPVTDIPKLIDDAKNLQKTADLRKAALDNI